LSFILKAPYRKKCLVQFDHGEQCKDQEGVHSEGGGSSLDDWGRGTRSRSCNRWDNSGTNNNTISIKSQVDGHVDPEDGSATEVSVSKGSDKSVGKETKEGGGSVLVWGSSREQSIHVLQETNWLEHVQVFAESNDISVLRGDGHGLSESLSVEIDLVQRWLVSVSGHWVVDGNEGWGRSSGNLSLEGSCVKFVGGLRENDVSRVVQVLSLPSRASNRCVNDSKQSVVRRVNQEVDVRKSKFGNVGTAVNSDLSCGQDENVSSNDVISGILIDHREISGRWARKTIVSSSKRRGNQNTSSHVGLGDGEEGKSVTEGKLSEERSDNTNDLSVHAVACGETSRSGRVVHKGLGVGVRPKPKSNDGSWVEDWCNQCDCGFCEVVDDNWVINRNSRGSDRVVVDDSLNKTGLVNVRLVARSVSSIKSKQQVRNGQARCSRWLSGQQKSALHIDLRVGIRAQECEYE